MQRRGRVILAVGGLEMGNDEAIRDTGMPGTGTAKLKGVENDGEMPRTLLLLFRGRSSGYQIFAAPLANNASLDKPESLFTIAGYSFVVFFLGSSNVDSSCCRFNLQLSEATFVALRFPFFFLDEFARACELVVSARTCYDYVQTSFLIAIACYWKIKSPRQETIGLWSAICFVYEQHLIVRHIKHRARNNTQST